MRQAEVRKVTVMLPRDLVERALKATKQGLTFTIRRGLETVAAKDAYEGLRGLRGKMKFAVDWKKLRED